MSKKPFTVAVEAQSLSRHKTGVSAYLAGVLSGWNKSKSWPQITLVLQGRKTQINPDYNLSFRVDKINLPRRVVSVLRKAHLFPAIDTVVPQHDIFFYPDFVRWRQREGKSVLMVHDLAYLHYPESLDQKNKRYLEKFVPFSLQDSDHVVVNSEATKADLLDNYEYDKKNVTVVYPGLDQDKYSPQSSQRIGKMLKKYNIDKDYILFVGTLEPRKNVIGLIEAYSSLPSSIQQKYQLVLAGGRGWNAMDIDEALVKHNRLNIVTPGFIDEVDMPALYSGAALFAFPSFLEGFGMPVVEAMACGAPVITVSNSSLPEAGGQAAVYVDATDIAALSTQIERVLSQPALAQQLSAKGLKQAKKFTWESSAIKLKGVFEKVAKE